MHSVLPDILKKFSTQYPGIRLHLYEMDNTQQIEALKKGTLDIGFLRSHMDEETIELYSVFEEPFVLVVPKSLRLNSIKPGTLKQLSEIPFIAFPLACAPDMVNSIYDVLRKLKLTPKHTHESSQINSIVRMVEAGIGYSLLPASATHAYKVGVKTYDLGKFKERARLFAAINKEKQVKLADNMVRMIM
jgi:DNA-binding transcriptional LysR family regulator